MKSRSDLESRWRKAALDASCEEAERESSDSLTECEAAADAAGELVLAAHEEAKLILLKAVDAKLSGIRNRRMGECSQPVIEALSELKDRIEALLSRPPPML